MDQVAHIPAKPDMQAQPEMLRGHVWHLDNGVEVWSIVQVIEHPASRCMFSIQLKQPEQRQL